ncbi:MAG TPA: XdhC family protein [Steroidobacteraceae bacterium]|nr:XdhC family protein [Steroidobacteraceae bacterium]
MSLHRLFPLFERARAADEALVLATVFRTGGSTYAKPGAQMLIAANGEYAGLLSGGCLEGDLREHASEVARSGEARIVSYDLRSTTDQLFGLGAGCEGAMDILLTRVSPAEHWQPLARMAESFRAGDALPMAFVVATRTAAAPLGTTFTGADAVSRASTAGVELFATTQSPPPRILLLGGGPDAQPVATLAAFVGWRTTVVDHRAAYLVAERFPAGCELLEARADAVAAAVALDRYAAAIVMSHHLDSDLAYLRMLARSAVPYVGLLGPAARREKLLADLGADAALLRPRLRAPIGLDIGGRAPESIALSIVGEVHAVLAGRGGRPFSEVRAADAS